MISVHWFNKHTCLAVHETRQCFLVKEESFTYLLLQPPKDFKETHTHNRKCFPCDTSHVNSTPNQGHRILYVMEMQLLFKSK